MSKGLGQGQTAKHGRGPGSAVGQMGVGPMGVGAPVDLTSARMSSASSGNGAGAARSDHEIIRTRAPSLTLVPATDERIGCALRRRREQLGISLSQLAEETKIRRDYIEAIERMDMKALPGTTYVTGYLKTISAELSLSAPEVLERFKHDCAMLRDGPVRAQRAPDRFGVPVASITFGLVMAGLCAVLVWRWVDTGLDQRTREAPELAMAGAPVAGGSEPILSAEDQPVLASAQPVLLRARGGAWLEVRGADGTVFISRTLQAGETYAPRLDAGWAVFARDAGQFEWVVGERVVGPLGEPGEPIFGARVGALLVSAETLAAQRAAEAEANAAKIAARAAARAAAPLAATSEPVSEPVAGSPQSGLPLSDVTAPSTQGSATPAQPRPTAIVSAQLITGSTQGDATD